MYIAPKKFKKHHQMASRYVLLFFLGSVTRYRPANFDKHMSSEYGPVLSEFLASEPSQMLFERRYVGDQAGPGLLARVITQYDDVVLYPPAYFHPTVGESKINPDLKHFLLAAHLFAGTWVEDNRQHYSRMWQANRV